MERDTITAYVDAAAAALELRIAGEHKPGVLNFFALAAQMAERVMAEPLMPDDESGSVFRPVEPQGTSRGTGA